MDQASQIESFQRLLGMIGQEGYNLPHGVTYVMPDPMNPRRQEQLRTAMRGYMRSMGADIPRGHMGGMVAFNPALAQG